LRGDYRGRPLRCASAQENYFGLPELTCRVTGQALLEQRTTYRGYGPLASKTTIRSRSGTLRSREGANQFE